MPENKYQHRDVLDKLGIRAGQIVACANNIEKIDASLFQRVTERTSRPPVTADEDEMVDIVLAMVDEETDAVALLQGWRQRIKPNGGIWLLSTKRGLPGYVDQRALILAGQQAGVVDNKICAISSTVSALRFVIRKAEH